MRAPGKLAIAAAAVIPFSWAGGIALANFAESGSFDQYRRPSPTIWHPAAPAPVPVRTTDLVLAAADSGGADRY